MAKKNESKSTTEETQNVQDLNEAHAAEDSQYGNPTDGQTDASEQVDEPAPFVPGESPAEASAETKEKKVREGRGIYISVPEKTYNRIRIIATSTKQPIARVTAELTASVLQSVKDQVDAKFKEVTADD